MTLGISSRKDLALCAGDPEEPGTLVMSDEL